MRPRRSGILVVPIALFAVAAGCNALTDTSTTTTTTTLTGQPIIEIDPADFLGDVVCADLPGAMRSYVVTFYDEGPVVDGGGSAPGFPIALPSSEPTPCSQRVAFGNGVVGHRYTAEIDGYEQAPDEIVATCSQKPYYARCTGEESAPAGGGTCTADTDCFANGCWGRCTTQPKYEWNSATSACVAVSTTGPQVTVDACDYHPAPGARHMVDAQTFAPVSPRWKTPDNEPCGWIEPIVTQEYQRITITPCAGLVDQKPGTSATGIRVLPGATLGTLACFAVVDGGTVGTVTAFDVEPTGSALTAQTNVSCDSTAGALYEQGVVPGKEYTFTVKAYENGQTDATQQAACFAVAKEGVIVLAKCDPLVPIAP